MPVEYPPQRQGFLAAQFTVYTRRVVRAQNIGDDGPHLHSAETDRPDDGCEIIVPGPVTRVRIHCRPDEIMGSDHCPVGLELEW